MSGTEKKLPIVEIVIFALVVAGAAFAWNTRQSRVTTTKDVAATPGGWASHAAPREHHRPALPREAVDRSEKLCVDMVRSQLGWRLKDSVITAEATDRYGVGDHDSGVGDSLIVEGIASTASGATHRFVCSMATLSSYYGSPAITFPDLPR